MKVFTILSIIPLFLSLLSCGDLGGSAIGPSTSTVKRIFLTDRVYFGNLNGVDRADLICSLDADIAKLGGKWIAYLSTTNENAIDKIKDVGPWYFTDGTTLVFQNKAQMLTGPSVTIDMNQNAVTLTTTLFAWTGTNTSGTVHTTTGGCTNWLDGTTGVNASVGSASVTDSTWQSVGNATCNLPFRLFCIEQ